MKKLFYISRNVILFWITISYFAYAQTPYSFSASSGTFVPLSGATGFTWNTTTAFDEEYTTATSIGFNFNYCGTVYTDFQVSTNGFLRFGTDLASATSADALSGVLRKIIAPLWDDLGIDTIGGNTTAGSVTYQLSGTTPSQVLTVEWKNIKWNKADSANAQFQVQLFENNGEIKFIYGNMDTSWTGRAASIGLVDNTTITTAGSATGKFLSINIGGWNGVTGTAVYHQTMSVPLNSIQYPAPDNTVFTFTPVTPSTLAGGTYTIGGTSPTYSSLSEAAMALNINGISGAVTFNVRPGVYDDIFHLINVAGTSVSNSITLKNESGTVTLTPSNGSVASTAPTITTGDAVIRLDGTQFTTIDGINITNNLQSSTALKFDMGICLGSSHLNALHTAGPRFNVIKNLTIDMNAVTGTTHTGTTGIRFGTYSGTETDTSLTTSWNTIQDVNIYEFWRAAVRMFGISSANPDRGNKITAVIGRNDFGNVAITTGTASDVRPIEMDCQSNIIIENTDIHDVSSSMFTTNGIRTITFNTASGTTNYSSGSIIIRNNKLYNLQNITTVTTGLLYGIELNVLKQGSIVQIYNNKLYNFTLSSTATSGHTSILKGILVNFGGTAGVHDFDTTYIYNNMISDLKAPNTSGTCGVRAIDLLNGAGNGTFYLYYNSVYLDNSVPPVMNQLNSGHNSACLQWGTFTTGNLVLQNNIFVNTMGNSFNGSGTSRAIVLYPGAASNFLRITSNSNNNLYYVNSPTRTGNAVRMYHNPGTVPASSITMTELQNVAGYAPRDSNSVADTVNFTSGIDLHLTGASIGNGNLATLPIAGYTNDIDGNTRNASYPYKGADEVTSGTFTPKLNLTALISGFTNPTTEKMISGDTLTVEIRNISSPYSLIDQTKVPVNESGFGICSFTSVTNGTPYYIVVKHRNAIQTWSGYTKSFSAYNLNYDFTTDSAKAFANNMQKVGTKWCLFNGDVNQDGAVDLLDMIDIDNDAFNFASGYLSTDANGDSNIDLLDMIVVDNNSYNFVGAITPSKKFNTKKVE